MFFFQRAFNYLEFKIIHPSLLATNTCFIHSFAGVGMLLFIAHARISLSEVKCRFYGPCAVNGVTLNEAKLHPLTEVRSFGWGIGVRGVDYRKRVKVMQICHLMWYYRTDCIL